MPDPNMVGRLTWADKDEPYVEVRLDEQAIHWLLEHLPPKDDTVRQLRHAARDIARRKDPHI